MGRKDDGPKESSAGQLPVPEHWWEASAVVQSEQDAQVHEEARGLVVAEMAAVTLADRLKALRESESVRVHLRDGSLVRGAVVVGNVDHVIVHEAQVHHLVPGHAIAAITGLPRSVHLDDESIGFVSNWRTAVRDFLGCQVSVSMLIAHTVLTGRLSWVGHDHIAVIDEGGEVVIAWSAVVDVRLPALSIAASSTS